MRNQLTMRLVALLAAPLLSLPLAGQSTYQKDIQFALKELEKNCGRFFKVKKINWKKVGSEFKKAAKKIKTDQDHLVLLVQLLARLEDGHAQVRPMAKGKGIQWPDRKKKVGPGMFWCRIDGKVYVKNAFSTAKEAGVKPGMQVVSVNGKATDKWLEARIAKIADLVSFSTPQQAEFYTCHWGLSDPVGTRMKLKLKDQKGKTKNRTITYRKASAVAQGPAYYPDGTKFGRNIHWSKTKAGFGYIQVRRSKKEVVVELDEALAALHDCPGIILDYRGNSGGGFDHNAFLGHFVPKGKKELRGVKRSYPSAGANPYGGPVVVIVDATCRSAGETGAGMFKEEGRGYVIGESATAGMSSQKKTIPLPSELFELYVSVYSNKAWYNKGRGIEGIGVLPHEVVSYVPKDLAAGRDTLILRAEALLQQGFPKGKVSYSPKRFGWKGGG